MSSSGSKGVGDDSQGTFAIIGEAGEPVVVENLDPQSPVNDLIVPTTRVSGNSLRVCMTRPRRGCTFKSCAVPIEWLMDGRDERRDPCFNAVRDGNYRYRWSCAVGCDDHCRNNCVVPGVVRACSISCAEAEILELQLSTAYDYELAVILTAPTDPTRTCIQDPVVGSGDEGGDPHQNSTDPATPWSASRAHPGTSS
ncbi:MAG: hypothetical protein MJE77_30245 [Proteobacteria bacterium]|nr:hypothetical protein [Pseudomonadota bacterium]